MLSYFNKPYPYLRDSKKALLTNLIIGFFVAFFLIVFKPFQINLWITEHRALKLAVFGFISFLVPTVVSSIEHWLVLRMGLEDQWKIWHQILSVVAVLSGIAMGNLIYGHYLHIMHFSLGGFFNAFIVVCTIGVFPVTFYVLNNQNKLLKMHLENARQVNESIEHLHDKSIVKDVLPELNEVVLISENEKDRLVLKDFQLLYIESADNYCSVVFTENGATKRTLMRSSLKRMQEQLNSKLIVRCHRAYIINLKNVKHIDGNAAGYKLSFEGAEGSIPVSRNYSQTVIETLKTLT